MEIHPRGRCTQGHARKETETKMQRPLPPFRVKPLRQESVRKTARAETIRALAESEPTTIKALRQPVRISRLATVSRLRVLGRAANDQD